MKKYFLFLLVSILAFNTYASDLSCKRALSALAFQDIGRISTDWVSKMQRSSPSATQERLNEAVQTNGFSKVALNRRVVQDHNSSYTNELPLGCMTNQKASGRCWIFAGNNMLRAELIKNKTTGKDFSLSHTYLHFFNMLEKSNRWLWNVEESQLQKLSRRDELKFTESDSFGDGGWYEWYQFLVAKYGMVPQRAMPDTASSLETSTLNQALKTVLSVTGMKIKALTKSWGSQHTGRYTTSQRDQLSQLREATMEKIFRILETHLGTPPAQFKFSSGGEDKALKTYSALTFRDDFIKYNPNDYVTVGNNERQPRNQFYEFSRSTIGVPELSGKNYPVQILNISFERMDQLIRNSIDAGHPMWFATDVGKFLDASVAGLNKSATGIWHPDIFKYAEVMGLEQNDFQLSQIAQSEFRLSQPNHAMVIVAYDKPSDAAQTVKYKIENSWGSDWADGGYGHMYREWAELYLAEVVIHKSLLTDQELALINAQPKEILEDDFY